MKIITTGSTGYIGNAVTRELVARGHEVTAILREESDASVLEDLGVRIERGSLSDMKQMRDLISEYGTAIHMASDHSEDAVNRDLAGIDALLDAEGPRHVIYTSGVWVFGSTGDKVPDETSPLNPLPIVHWRPGHESLVTEMSRDEIDGTVIRPGCVYGHGESLLAGFFEAIENDEPVEIAGDGQNHWAMIHLDDLARLYATVAEKRLSGIFHGIDQTRMTLNEIANALAEAAGKEAAIRHTPHVEVMQNLGGFGEALMVDQTISSEVTRLRTGWEPRIDSLSEVTDRLWQEWREARAG